MVLSWVSEDELEYREKRIGVESGNKIWAESAWPKTVGLHTYFRKELVSVINNCMEL